MTLVGTAASVLTELHRAGHRGCLVGGLAVSVRCDPRFTRDADLAVAVANDAEAEAIGRALAGAGYVIGASIEQEAVGRLAMLRVFDRSGTSVDLLFASSGIEAEVVADAELLEAVRGIRIPVARVGHLIAVKLLSVAPGRETDAMDLRGLAAVADDDEWQRSAAAVALITERGYSRGRDLARDLRVLRGH